MKLKAAARRFDKLVCADAYNPATTFKGQIGLYDDSTRDGMTVERRVLSVAPEVTIPARRTIIADGLTWMLGDHHRDYFKESAVRHKYVAHQADELVSVKTFEQAIAGTAVIGVWASRVWVKAAKEIEASSDITNVYDIYFAKGENVPEGSLIQMSGRWHLVRTTYPTTAGLLVALSDELPEPVLTPVTVTLRTYVPATDTYTTSATTVTALRIRWQSLFRYPVRAADKYKPGDVVLLVRKSDGTVKAGDRLPVAGETFNVISVLDEGTLWSCHLRND